MKRYIYITRYLLLFMVLGTWILTSCSDYLESDQYFDDRMNVEKVFTSKIYSEEWLAHTFSGLENECADVCSKGYTPHCFSDDMYYGDRDVEYDVSNAGALSYNNFHTGVYDEDTKQDSWSNAIRVFVTLLLLLRISI